MEKFDAALLTTLLVAKSPLL